MSAQDPGGTAPCGDTFHGIEAIWRRERRWVAAVLIAHMPARCEVDDLLQEVALALVRSADTLRDPTNVRAWLRTTALNVARGAGRKENVRRRVHVALGHAAAASAVDLGAVRARECEEARWAAERVMALVERLPAEFREPLLLRSVRGLSQRRIAEILGVTETTVETRLARARRRLRESWRGDREPYGIRERGAEESGTR